MCSLLSCAGGQAACLHHFYHILHLSCVMPWRVWLQLWWAGPGSSRGLRAGVEVTPGLARSGFCVSAWMLQQEIRGASRLNEACKISTLQSGKAEQRTQIKNKITVKSDNFCVFFFCS